MKTTFFAALRRSIHRLLPDRSGLAAIEMAALAPILVAIPIGLWTAGEVLLEKTNLQRAAAAAAQYGSQSELTAEGEFEVVRSIVRRSYSGDDSRLTITPETVTLCDDGSSLLDLTAVGCQTSDYLRVRVSLSHSPTLDFGFFPDALTLTEEVTLRHMY